MRAYDPGKIGCYAGWRRYEKNPIIGEQIGEVSDPMVLPIKDRFHLYYSQKEELKEAYRKASQPHPAAVPLDWMETKTPEKWQTYAGRREYNF